MTDMPIADDVKSPPPGTTPSEMFPVLNAAQQARVLAHGQRRTANQDEIVVELNEHITKVFVVVSGELHILQVSNNQEHVVALCNPGMFTGELNVLSGRRGLRAHTRREKLRSHRNRARGIAGPRRDPTANSAIFFCEPSSCVV
jgi:CRP-like cAMP-binding protein